MPFIRYEAAHAIGTVSIFVTGLFTGRSGITAEGTSDHNGRASDRQQGKQNPLQFHGDTSFFSYEPAANRWPADTKRHPCMGRFLIARIRCTTF